MIDKRDCILIHLLEKNYSSMFYIAGHKLEDTTKKISFNIIILTLVI